MKRAKVVTHSEVETRMIKLGDKVKDRITGYTGIVVFRMDWLYGCVRFVVQSQTLDEKGKPIDNASFDLDQLCLIEADALADKATKTEGGDRDYVARRR